MAKGDRRRQPTGLVACQWLAKAVAVVPRGPPSAQARSVLLSGVAQAEVAPTLCEREGIRKLTDAETENVH